MNMEELYINYGLTATYNCSYIGWILPAVMLMFFQYSTDASVESTVNPFL